MEAPTFSPPQSPRRQSRSPKKNSSPLKQVLVREARRAQHRQSSIPPTPKFKVDSKLPDRGSEDLQEPAITTTKLTCDTIHLTPARAQTKPLKAWERQARAVTQKNGKSRKIWKRPLAQQQGPNGERPSQNTRAKSRIGEWSGLANALETPKKIVKKVRVESDTPVKNEEGDKGNKVKHRVVGRDRRRSSLPHKQRSTQAVQAVSELEQSDELAHAQTADGANVSAENEPSPSLDDAQIIADEENVPVEHEQQLALQATGESPDRELQDTSGEASNEEDDFKDVTVTSIDNQSSPSLSSASPSAATPKATTDRQQPSSPPSPDERGLSSENNGDVSAFEQAEDVDPPSDNKSQDSEASKANFDHDLGFETSYVRAEDANTEDIRNMDEPSVLPFIESVAQNGREFRDTRQEELAAQRDFTARKQANVEDENVFGQSPERNQIQTPAALDESRALGVMPVLEGEDEDESFSPVRLAAAAQAEDDDEDVESDDTSSTVSSEDLDAMLADDTATLKPSQVQNDTGPIEAPSSPVSSPAQVHYPFQQASSPNEPQQPTSPELTSPTEAPPPTPSQIVPLNDDETLLHDFLARTKASKAARIASQEHASQRRDSDAIKTALSSRAALDEITANVTSPSGPQLEGESSADPLDADMEGNLASPTLMLDFNTPSLPTPASEDPEVTASPSRLKRRSRRPNASSTPEEDEPAGPARISLRHGPHVPFVPRKSEAQALTLATRTNTRRNRGGSVSVKLTLKNLKNGVAEAEEGERVETKEKRGVRWNEELVSYFQEKGSEELVAGLDEGDEGRDVEKKEEVKPANRRKRALGAVNGTPAKLRSRDVSDGGKDDEGTAGKQRGRKRPAEITEESKQVGQAEDKPRLAKARRLPSAAAPRTKATWAQAEKERESPPEQPSASSATQPVVPSAAQTDAVQAEAKPQTAAPARQIPRAKRSALPQRTSVRVRK